MTEPSPARAPIVGASVVAGLLAVAAGFLARSGLSAADQLLCASLFAVAVGSLLLLFRTALPGRSCLVTLLAIGLPIAAIIHFDDPPRFPKDWRYVLIWSVTGALVLGLIFVGPDSAAEPGDEPPPQPLS